MTYSLLTPFKMRLSCRFFHSQLVLRSNVSRNLNINQQERLNKLVQDENYKFWLGGFIEGEGALVISIVKDTRLKNGISLKPEFNVVQHENGIEILHSFRLIFNNKGNVFKKSGSDKVWVYSIKGTQNIIDLVIPFFKKYVVVFSSKYKSEVFNNFCHILNKLDRNHNTALSKERLIELVKLVYLINPEGKGKQRKRTLEETLNIINSSN